MLLYVVRHGVTAWNRLRKVQGRADIPLAEEGVRLAVKTGEALRDVPFDLCFSSPLKRAVQTAECILGDRKVPVITDERIQEIDFGALEGTQFKDESGNISHKQMEIFFQRPLEYERPENGENIEDILKRTEAFWKDITGREEFSDKTILISSHGCAVRALLQNVYQDRENFWHGKVPPNCSVNIVEVKDGKGRFIEEDKVY
ncbi:MAG: histidine phosphatase family protein [Eubacteriales bacterium]|nr:histidine phosphatase family protein [Eubacteriales bacterium]